MFVIGLGRKPPCGTWRHHTIKWEEQPQKMKSDSQLRLVFVQPCECELFCDALTKSFTPTQWQNEYVSHKPLFPFHPDSITGSQVNGLCSQTCLKELIVSNNPRRKSDRTYANWTTGALIPSWDPLTEVRDNLIARQRPGQEKKGGHLGKKKQDQGHHPTLQICHLYAYVQWGINQNSTTSEWQGKRKRRDKEEEMGCWLVMPAKEHDDAAPYDV